MTRFGIDHSSAPPDPAKLRDAGVDFVCRYVSTPGNPKNIDAAEVVGLHAHGIAVVLVFETTADRALAGYSAGLQDARNARAQAFAIGLFNAPIYFAVDFDVTGKQELAVKDYLRGAARYLGKKKTGVYGGYTIVRAMLDAGVCKYGWQTYAWSRGLWDRRAHIQQYRNGVDFCGISVDYDRATKRDYGQIPAPLRARLSKAARRKRLRAWIVARHAKGATWAVLKRTTTWRAWRKLGGR